jgi:flagellar FliJ protein
LKRLQTLQLLLEKEQRKRDEAQAVVRNAYANLEQQKTQADGLASYRVEYCAKWAAKFQQGSSMEILRSYHGFMARLDQAITQQQAVVAHAQRGVDGAKERLLEREIRVATVERLIQRRRDLLARIVDRRDQKNLDEMAARRVKPKELAGLA